MAEPRSRRRGSRSTINRTANRAGRTVRKAARTARSIDSNLSKMEKEVTRRAGSAAKSVVKGAANVATAPARAQVKVAKQVGKTVVGAGAAFIDGLTGNDKKKGGRRRPVASVSSKAGKSTASTRARKEAIRLIEESASRPKREGLPANTKGNRMAIRKYQKSSTLNKNMMKAIGYTKAAAKKKSSYAKNYYKNNSD